MRKNSVPSGCDMSSQDRKATQSPQKVIKMAAEWPHKALPQLLLKITKSRKGEERFWTTTSKSICLFKKIKHQYFQHVHQIGI